ncbi:DUF3060 domain-containing protein [Mycobacterium sp. B14F4]|uniref:DUF3060 domain-containing protein n=1 Tax=Mycobacterium sp. B14F4 TaxID=3153565 RepID=UPI00325DFC7E
MNPEEDPEARIRQLEQPLAGYAVELGGTETTQAANPTAQLPPPVYDDPYQQSHYSAPPFGVAYPQVPKKGAPIGLIFGLLAVVVVLVFGGIGAFVWIMWANTDIAGSPASDPGVTWPTAVPTGLPTALPTGLPTAEPSAPEVAVAPAGGQYSVSGIDETETVDCNGGNISVSGVNNTVTLLGHCLSVTVSGVENQVTVDSADEIGASGFDNQVIYHSGEPQVDATSGNIVAQG